MASVNKKFNVDIGLQVGDEATARLWIDATSVGIFATAFSDYRIKRNVESITESAIDRVKKLRPVKYQRKDYGILRASDKVKEGFIAHELVEVIPSAVIGEKDDPNNMQSLKLDPLVAVLTKAIQEQQETIEKQQKTIENMQKTIDQLMNRIN